MAKNEGILLETGTNEFELIEFIIENKFYGINVSKIREVIEKPEKIFPVPKTHPCLEGVTNIRNEIISIANLKKFLNIEESGNVKKPKIIITEFNAQKMGFIVDSVTRIYRLSWENVIPPDKTFAGHNAYITSVVKLDDKIILMLDFEKIVMEINNYSSLETATDFETQFDINRSKYTLLIAEDSATIKDIMVKKLSDAGYNVIDTSNGKEALNVLFNSDTKVDLVITDIEMPELDGYTLCKRIKTNKEYSHIPVIIYSSLISPDVIKKGKSVGADAQLTKPELGNLLTIVDKYIMAQS